MPLSNEEIEIILRDDPYEILGIARDASEYELMSAYRSKAKQYHPDLHPNDIEYGVAMRAINDAYERILTGKIDRDFSIMAGFSWKPVVGYHQDTQPESSRREGIPETSTSTRRGPAPSVFV